MDEKRLADGLSNSKFWKIRVEIKGIDVQRLEDGTCET
jgi:hypothetical protein